MKIVIINGQNHKGSTWNIGNLLVRKIEGEKEIVEYFLPHRLKKTVDRSFPYKHRRYRYQIYEKAQQQRTDVHPPARLKSERHRVKIRLKVFLYFSCDFMYCLHSL